MLVNQQSCHHFTNVTPHVQVEEAKRIEAKTIRDGIGDMKASLEGIKKRIGWVARDTAALQTHFHSRASSVMEVFNKMRDGLCSPRHSRNKMSSSIGSLSELSTVETPRFPTTLSFLSVGDDEDREDTKSEESPLSLMSSLSNGLSNGKPRRFRIIDNDYFGDNKIRKRKDRVYDNLLHDDEENKAKDSEGKPMMKKKGMIKVKIRRMRRVRPRNQSKTAKAIRWLRKQKEVCFV